MSTDWLSPIRRALDGRADAIDVFLRDDDAGWEDARLDRQVRQCDAYGLPLDLAVIPAAVTDECAARLLRLRRAHRAGLGLHQHGWAHTNHEAAGRACEFGPSRSAADVRRDIAAGREVMHTRFGDAVDPVFTPPWNRCTDATAQLLSDLGFEVLSRDSTARPVDAPDLIECPTTTDWFAKRHGRRLGRDEWALAAAAAFAGRRPVGLLLHHAVMDDGEFEALDPVLRLIAGHPACRPCSLLDAARRAGRPDLTMEKLR